MAKHERLSKLSDWELVHPEQDVRGWEVHDRNGQKIGRVDDLLVSTDTELVEVLRLDDGKEFPARDVEIGDRVVYLKGQRPATKGDDEPVVKVYDETRVRHRGKTGKGGTTGTSSTAGKTGASGTAGKTGATGTSGRTGTSGTAGKTGATGTSGRTGTSGTAGKTGASGTSGTSSTAGKTGTARGDRRDRDAKGR